MSVVSGWVPGRVTSLVLAAVCWSLLVSCRPASPPPPATGAPEVDVAALAPRIHAFCGDCHASPAPDTFPRDAWHAEVEQGFNFYRESGRHDLDPPPMNEVVAYYRTLAPATWELPPPPQDEPHPLQFARRAIPFTGEDFPGVSHLLWQGPAAAESSGRLLVCDMRAGQVAALTPGTETTPQLLAQVPHPAHITPTDLDADGITDFLVSDLGSYQPEDHRQGRIVWLRRTDDTQEYQQLVLAEDLGRVADVQPADFNGDGVLDLIVAEFGWRKTGRLLMLWGTGAENGRPTYRPETIDPRHGVIHVPAADLNGDQLPDFVALVSQEFETIEAYINLGGGKFERRQLFAAGDPSFGSSGIQLVDMDGDLDLDVLYTNGDTLDSYYLKPYHAVHWLENLGQMEFRHHRLTNMPGVYRAVAADLDGDGDQDVVACSYVPRSMLSDGGDKPYDTLIWLEQTAPGKFVRHRLEQTTAGHMALEAADFDGDGDVDLAVGNYGNQPDDDAVWLRIWENQGVGGTALR